MSSAPVLARVRRVKAYRENHPRMSTVAGGGVNQVRHRIVQNVPKPQRDLADYLADYSPVSASDGFYLPKLRCDVPISQAAC